MSFAQIAEPRPKPTNFVKGEGPLQCNIALVGEAPGTREVNEQRPFCGPAGHELDKLLHSAGILRTKCYVTNTVKEQPQPTNADIKKFIDVQKGIITLAGQVHVDYLKEELKDCSANIIIALGAVSLFVLTGKRGITKWSGSILESTLLPGRKVIGTFHPSTLIGLKANYLNRHLIVFDMRRAVEESQFPELHLPSMILHTAPTKHDVMTYLEECKNLPILDVDIEVLREEVSCIAIAKNGHESMSIPFVGEHGNYWNPDDEADIWLALADILEDPTIIKRGQNFIFDATFLLSKHGIRTTNIQDCMIAQAILYPDYKKGLDFICRMHTKMPYYKDDGKQWSRLSGDWKQHWEYNCKDTIATALAYPVQLHELKVQNNIPTYIHQERLIEPLMFMQQRGIKMDIHGLELARESAAKEIEQLTNKLYSMCGMELNINSPKQMCEYFYIKKGITPYINKESKKPRCDDDALMRLARGTAARPGLPEAQLIRNIREIHTLHSRYLTVVIDNDNRIRCALNPVGTKTGRLSSGKTIFRTGMNLQNLSPDVRKFLLVDENYICYNIDLSQAENRIVAYCGPVPEMIDCFETGQDVHSKTAGLMFGLPPAEIKRMDKEDIRCAQLAGGRYTHRNWGKKANHGLNYDEGANTFSEKNDIMLAEAKMIIDLYHKVYPGVRNGFHRMLRDMLSMNRTTVNPMGRKRTYLGKWDDKLFREAYNNFPQSTVADVINERGIEYVYFNTDPLFEPVELLLQVHDSIIFQIPITTPWLQHAAIINKIKQSLEIPLQWKGREFVLPIDLSVSFHNLGKKSKHNLLGLEEIERSKLNDVQELASILEAKHRVFTG